jgi:endonuclease-3 related protein
LAKKGINLIKSAYELLIKLQKINLLQNKPLYWWPGTGSFKVVLGAILTQNTKWENVEKSLANLDGFLELDTFLRLDIGSIKEAIRSSGFYNQKAKALYKIAREIKDEFNTFEEFQKSVSREWLLKQYRVGFESADSILCYGCYRDVMVVDAYSNRLLKSFGYEFESYSELQEWFEDGVLSNWDRLKSAYNENLNLCYARYHGKIVEFVKSGKSLV